MQVGTKMYWYVRNKSKAVMLTVRRRKDMLIDNVKIKSMFWESSLLHIYSLTAQTGNLKGLGVI